MVAQQCGLEVGEFIWSGGDIHAYTNHIDQIKEQLTRDPFELPRLVIKTCPKDIFSYHYDLFEFKNYKFHPTIKAPIAV